jgi:hypothetical protein
VKLTSEVAEDHMKESKTKWTETDKESEVFLSSTVLFQVLKLFSINWEDYHL